MRVAFVTHGCRLNRADSDAMAGHLRAHGHEIVAADAEAIVVNTCTITHGADADARRVVRRLRRAHPDARIVTTGCWATAQPELARALGSDAVLDNAHKPDIAQTLVPAARLTRSRADAFGLPAAVADDRARARLKVQDGCNYRCAFCIVPQVRGASRSLPVESAQAQLRGLVAAGAPEVVLTGVHLGTWGRDLRPRRSVAELVEALLPHLGSARLRLSSIDPHEVDDALIDLWVAHPRALCRHLHLPVQSADDEVLRAMRRGHDASAFVDVVQRAVARVPGISIGTDVIAGFPTETAAAFERTLARLAALPLAYLHVFSYSPRADTVAAGMDDIVGVAARAERTRRLRALSSQREAAFARAQAGTLADVVCHRRPDREGLAIGVTDNFVRLQLSGSVAFGARIAARVDATGRRAEPVSA
jgi:threonylcarbamoyladenosine tRNA methylthiotransferase MtaB